jgi:putative transposase
MPSGPENGDSAQPLIRIESRKWKRLVGAEDRQLTKIRNQIRDLLHKQSTRLVKTLHERRVGTVVARNPR